MPELPEVETVRRMLEGAIPGRRIARASVSRKRLRTTPLAPLAKKLEGRTFAKPRRTGKFLLLDLEGGDTLLSHLGMSGRWLYWRPGGTPGVSRSDCVVLSRREAPGVPPPPPTLSRTCPACDPTSRARATSTPWPA